MALRLRESKWKKEEKRNITREGKSRYEKTTEEKRREEGMRKKRRERKSRKKKSSEMWIVTEKRE